MNSEQKARLEAALKELESGKYRQGYEVLRKETGDGICYCCLGVLTDYYNLQNNKEWVMHNESDTVYHFESEDSYLPVEVMKWYGFSDIDPVLITEYLDENGNLVDLDSEELEEIKRLHATELNDSRDYSFKELADLFRQEYLKELE